MGHIGDREGAPLHDPHVPAAVAVLEEGDAGAVGREARAVHRVTARILEKDPRSLRGELGDGRPAAGTPPDERDGAVAGDIGSARPQAAAEAALVTARRIHGIEVLHDLELLVYLLAGVDDLPVRRDRERRIAAIRPERREVAIPGPHRIGHRLGRSAAWSRA